MRPAGEIRQALEQACAALAQPEQGPTLRELAAHARVGLEAARGTVSDMRRAGVVRIARTRRVDYRNRPVAEYEPAPGARLAAPSSQGLARVLTTWVG